MTRRDVWVTVALLAAVVAVGGCTGGNEGGPASNSLTPQDAVGVAVAWLQDQSPDKAPPADISWEQVETSKDLAEVITAGLSRVKLVSAEWQAIVTWPTESPEGEVTYTVRLASPVLGWYWQGYVNEQLDDPVVEQQPLQLMTQDTSLTLAGQFVTTSPTFQYDGVPYTFKYVETLETPGDYSWRFVFSFSCEGSGYGIRTGQPVEQVLTPHVAEVMISSFEVTGATMDGQWDMLAQQLVPGAAEAQKAAEEFLRSSATYAYDGLDMTLRLTGMVRLDTDQAWRYSYMFDSGHKGYGDRTGQDLPSAVTSHEAGITVVQGTVSDAVLDNQWDMVRQRFLPAVIEARTVAERFVSTSATFVFDGIPSTLELVDTRATGVDGSWEFVFTFESAHAGYGDRTGDVLAEVMMPHEADVVVGTGEIVSAYMDGRWNMLRQEAAFDEESVRLIAEEFVRNSPTFARDGIPETLEVVEAHRVDPTGVWEVIVHFDSSHAGYGARENQLPMEVVTSHEAKLSLRNGKVTRAVLDGLWDMLAQQML